jgi:uncharacterized protein (TIGR03435 family)
LTWNFDGHPIKCSSPSVPSIRTFLSLSTALQEQLGLKLESAKGPVDVELRALEL